MFDFLKKKKDEYVFAPVDGNYIPLIDVNDPVFSQKMMGEGFGIQPTSSEIYAPIKGTITTIFQTKHAIGLTGASGEEVLLHIGIDTVELAGDPFEVFVKIGQTVDENTLLVRVNLKKIREAGKSDIVLTLFTNGTKSYDALDRRQVKHGESLN
ncbi:PTS glucose transporter subunit IIA [Enterococcus devriesei]|uniref:PTS sugar transporter subunit IIA n=1 Tax=Enterococcus devriesei TaxID=319970 RepID=UPI001C11399D|nr:PTS glucose transporter subunit IIA [Enterococcus devriesei]